MLAARSEQQLSSRLERRDCSVTIQASNRSQPKAVCVRPCSVLLCFGACSTGSRSKALSRRRAPQGWAQLPANAQTRIGRNSLRAELKQKHPKFNGPLCCTTERSVEFRGRVGMSPDFRARFGSVCWLDLCCSVALNEPLTWAVGLLADAR